MTTLAAVTQGYDLAGNLTLAYSADRGTSYTYRYDHHNRLTGVYDSTDTTRKAAFGWDALGRRIEHVNDVVDTTVRYAFDGVNELAEFEGGGERIGHYVHGVSYVDERLLRVTEKGEDDTPYYYVVDRMYNVRLLLDRAGAIVERYAYDSYGRPLIRESCGRGDMNNDTKLSSTDTTRFDDANDDTIWDPRADMDDDGDVDTDDQTLYDAKFGDWSGLSPSVDPRQAFSDAGNPYLFQGVPHFPLDTETDATAATLPLNHHRARFAEPVTGRWTTRDPLYYNLIHVDVPENPSSYRSQASTQFHSQELHIIAISISVLFPLQRDTFHYLESCPANHNDYLGLCTSESAGRVRIGGGANDGGAQLECESLARAAVESGRASGCEECTWQAVSGSWVSNCVNCINGCQPLHCQCNPFGIRICQYDGGTGCSCRCVSLPIPVW